MKLHIDIETYSSVDITKAGAYKYIESLDFEILLVAYAFDDTEVRIVDLANGEELDPFFTTALRDPDVEKHAHNATFERKAFEAVGIKVPIDQWHCSAIKAAYCGLPLGLAQVSKALKLDEIGKGKQAIGKALIKYFSCPVKPTKVNGQRHRNLPHHNPEKWGLYKMYCLQDVEAEREIGRRLERYEIPEFERRNYILDQEINDRGIMVDLVLASNAYEIDGKFSADLIKRMQFLTGLENPNSVAQLKQWLGNATGKAIKSLAKDVIPELLEDADEKTTEVLQLRQQGSKSSTKKYLAMLNCVCEDDRAHGLFQFYGANRTGRWAGRLVQLQNLPQNKIEELDTARDIVRSGDYELCSMSYENVSSILSQLIRTAFIAKPGHTFAVADFSAIEARVIAWLAGEKWRLDVFNSHGKIYEASASKMFGVPIDEVNSALRAKGKVAELALGYQGAVGALRQMGGEAMGLDDDEMQNIVTNWRRANPKIKKLWSTIENCAHKSIQLRCRVPGPHGLEFNTDENNLMVKLPSGRSLFYHKPTFGANRFGAESIKYRGMDQTTKQWTFIETYGGKLVENIVQAIARDLLAASMLRLNEAGFEILAHIHDEVICEIQDFDAHFNPGDWTNGKHLQKMCEIMGEPVYWAPGLPSNAEGFLSNYYKKD